jgi:serine/threonine protein kinase
LGREHLARRSHVAVKLMSPAVASSSDAIRRFEGGVRAASALRSPNVVQILDFGLDTVPFLVMELLKGESLAQRLERRGALAWSDVWSVMSQLGRAMSVAHDQGVIHRDLKPSNVFLSEKPAQLGRLPSFVVKVLDFGLAKVLQGGDTDVTVLLTQKGVLLGMPVYMSPEQAQGRPVDARSDLWSMAVLAFECITGRLPFDAPTLPLLLRAICTDPIIVPSTVARVPRGFDAWFARATTRDRDSRFPSVKEFLAALAPLLASDASEPPPGAPVSSRDPDPNPAHLHISDAFASAERRREPRIPSSIPAGINGKRDFDHSAVIHNASRTGALLITNYHCHPNQVLHLSFQIFGRQHGTVVPARVMRVGRRHDGRMWKFDVGVRFEVQLGRNCSRRLRRGRRGRLGFARLGRGRERSPTVRR